MRKRLLSMVITVCMMLTLLPTSVFAAEAFQLALQVDGNGPLAVNDTVTVKVKVENCPDNLRGLQFKVTPSTDKLHVQSDTANMPAGAMYQNHGAVSPNLHIYQTYYAYTNALTTALTGDIFTITYEATEAIAAPVTFTLEYVSVTAGTSSITPSATPTAVMKVELSGELAITGVTAPAKGGTPVTSVTAPANTTATIKWYAVSESASETELTSGSFAGDTVYKAVINIKPDTGYVFADGVTFTVDSSSEGWTTSAKKPDGSYDLTKTFPATEGKALTGIAISGDTTKAVPLKGNTATVTLTATASYDDSSTGNVTSSATWTIDPAYTGVSVANGVVTIQPSAEAGSVTVKAEYNGKTNTHTITLNKATPAVAEIVATAPTTTTVNVAATDQTSTAPTAKVYDQYGAEMTGEAVTWAMDPATVAGVTLNTTNAKLTVTSDASAITVTITATSGSGADTVTGTKTVSITKAPAVPTTVTISGGVSSVNVPEVETLGTPGSYTTSAFTATVKDQYGQVMTDRAVTWSVLGDQDTIYMTPDGKLHLTSEKWNGSTTVTATVTGTDVKGTKDVTINRDQGIYRKAKFVEIYNGEAKVTTDSIVIPSGSTPNTAAYTAKVYDQYDVLMSEFADLNWSLSSTPTGVTMTDGTVTVASSASVTGSTPLTLTATAGTGTSAPMATVDISIVNKQTATVSITGLPDTVTYGTEFTLTASAKDSGGNTLTGGTWTWSFDAPTFEEVSKNGASITLKAKKASTDPQSIKATYEDANYRGDANTTNFQVKPRPITVTAPADYKVSKTYDGTTNAGTPTGSLTADGILSGDAVTVKATPAAYANANVHDGNVAVNLELDGSKKDNYKLNAASVSVPCEITAKELTNLVFTGVSVTKVYDTSTSAGTVSGAISFDGKVGSDEVSIKATAGNYTDANVGTGKTVPLTLALDGTAKDNYKLNSYTHSFTTASITKANYSGTFSKTVDIVKGRSAAQTGSLTAADFLATPPAGAKINSVGGGSHTIISNLTVSDGELNYTSNANIAATADETYTVTISSTNYDDITATLKFHPTDKQPQAALTINSANSVTYGQTLTLSTTGGSSGGAVTYAVSAGTGTATVAGAVLTPTTAGTVTVVATMAGDDTYEAVSSAPFTVTIAKATPAGTPSYTSITSGGKTLADAALGIGSITPTGSIKWVDSDGTTELLGTTAVAANTAYKWLFTPADTANYNTLTGTLTLYHVSTGGGGGSVSYAISVDKAQNGSITVSPKNASKGDTVTITVAPDKGYTLETLTVLDKNGKEISVTAKDGKYSFRMPAGKVTVKATFAEDNSMLNFFVDVPASEYYYDAVKWAVENGITTGINETEFGPDLGCTRGQIVTFLWRAAGCPEPKNMSSFSDVSADAFYAKAVAWAVENGITSGIGGGKFAPDETCTRAQSATFLYRAAGSPAVSGSAAFSDVGADTFYANAVAWAAKEGITGGIGGGLFGSELECTRAQIVTFLYRSIVK